MNILFFTHYFPPEVNAPASRTYEHARLWIKAGHKVTIITNHPNHPHGRVFTGYKNKFISKEVIDGIQVIRLWTYLAPNAGVLKRSLNYTIYALLAFFTGIMTNGFDIVVGTTPQFFCGLSGLAVAKLKGKPFIGEVRDLWPDSIVAVDAFKDKFFVNLLYKLEELFYEKSDHLVVLTRSFGNHVENICDTPYTFIPNGVSWDFWHSRKMHQNGNLQLSKGAFKVGYIGTFGMAHGLDLVLDVAKTTRNQSEIHYYLIGDGAERQHLEQRVEDEEINNIDIYGLQPKKSIPAILQQLDVILVLLKNEKLFETVIPSKLFEGMVMAKPLIVGLNGETKQLVNDAKAGVTITPESKEELQSAIMDLYHNPARGHAFGENGKAYIKRYFLREKLANQFLPIFNNLLPPTNAVSNIEAN